jgi:hypothetical protein
MERNKRKKLLAIYKGQAWKQSACMILLNRSASFFYALRASTISPSQLAIRNKIVFLCLVGGERIGERREVGSHARASSSTCS